MITTEPPSIGGVFPSECIFFWSFDIRSRTPWVFIMLGSPVVVFFLFLGPFVPGVIPGFSISCGHRQDAISICRPMDYNVTRVS